MREFGATTFFISESPPGNANPTSFGADFLADGIIFLKRFEIKDDEVQLRLQVTKMRKAHHETGFFALNFEGGKFYIAKAILQ